MPVLPMYIAGRLRTASRPSRTLMSSAPYRAAAWAVMPFLYLCPPDASYPHRHDHAQEPLLRRLANEARAQRIFKFHDHLRRIHRPEHVQEVASVESRGQRLSLVGRANIFFGLTEVRVAG